MLTDDQLSLVSAAVDRELLPDQAATFRALVNASPEAARLFRQLADQSTGLKRLPRRPAPPGLRAAVLARIDPPAVRRPVVRSTARWLPYAVAASALAAVTAWYAARPAAGPAVAAVVPAPVPPQPELPPPEPAPTVVAATRPPEPTPQTTPGPKVVAANKPKPASQKAVPGPRPSTPDALGAPLFTPPKLAQVEVQLPFLVSVAELDLPDVQTRLKADLDHDGPVRLDLFARDPQRGAEAVLAVARQAGVAVSVDALARDRMKKKLPTPAYAVYTDSLMIGDVAKLAAALAAFDRRPEQGLFVQAHLVPLRDADRKDMKELLGTDPDSPRKARDRATDGTKAKPGEKTGVLVAYLPPAVRANPTASKEVHDYLARRDDRKPGAVSLLVTVRATGP